MNAKRISMLAVGVLFGCMLATARARAPVSGIQAFGNGTAAFRMGNYSRALADFLKARRAGIKAPQLGYDLGVTYYHLGRYTQARHEFTLLAGIPTLTAVSHYNLGLIAMQQHNKPRARAEFTEAYVSAREPALRTLALVALHTLGAAPTPGLHWTAFADADAGYNSNVTLTSESTVLTPAHRGSDVYSLLAGAIGQLSGNYQQGWQAVGTFYRIDYPAVSQFNQSYLHLGGQYRWSSGSWSHRLGFYAGDLSLGNANFETLATLSADSRLKSASGNSLHAFYRYTRVRGGSGYDYLTGWHQSLGIEETLKIASTDLTLGYSFDFNERNNFNSASQFLSTSPTDNSLYALLDWHLSDATRLFLETDYQHSHYQGANTVLQGGTSANIFREENWWSTAIGISYSFSKHWSLRLDGSFTDNRSNIPQFSYHSNQIMFSLEYVFPH